MNAITFNALFAETTYIGEFIQEETATYFYDNGKAVGMWIVDRRTTVGIGHYVDSENAEMARYTYGSPKTR